jgi:prolyl-tRNA editing enzyme YbaK/EbsC (Cys-tRNA(Pro) deacylase)
MGRYNIEWFIPYDLDKINIQDLRWRPLKMDTMYFKEREEIIEKDIIKNNERLSEMLISDINTGTEKNPVYEKPPFILIKKEKTESIKDAANHLGIPKSRISKTVVAVDDAERIHLLTVLNDGYIPIENGILINETEEKVKGVKMIDRTLINTHTGMEAGWCSPFLPKEEYLKKIQYLLFEKEYSMFDKLVDIGLGPEESILMRPRDIYAILKSLYIDKVLTF